MVDKLIGDGMFALFNVPLDLANHVERAVAAAQAIVAATESYRRTPLPAALALAARASASSPAWPLSAMSAVATRSISPPSAAW